MQCLMRTPFGIFGCARRMDVVTATEIIDGVPPDATPLRLGPAEKQVVRSVVATLLWYRHVGGVEPAPTAKFQAPFSHLDERRRRLAIGAEARPLGHGGIRGGGTCGRAGEGTVSHRVAELESQAAPLDRIHQEGGGRKRAVEFDLDCGPPCWPWSSRTCGAIRCRPCAR
jgi:hypothetical protein